MNCLRILIALGCGVLALAVQAADLPTREVKGSTLLQQRAYGRYIITNGQVRITSQQFGGGMSTSSSSGKNKESLRMNFSPQGLTVNYEQVSDTETLRLNVQSGGQQLNITVVPAAEGVQFDFVQDTEVCRLSAKLGDQTWEASGSTVWHLFLAEPEFCRKQLAPILETCRADWRLTEKATNIEEMLVETAKKAGDVDVDRYLTLVKNLASPTYAERQVADRQLRAAGRAIVPFLQSLDLSQYDAEIRFRVTTILAEYGGNGEDTPQSAAQQLMSDRKVWLYLLRRNELDKRQLALSRLEKLTGSKLDFDPAADAETRKASWEKLAAKFVPPPKPVEKP